MLDTNNNMVELTVFIPTKEKHSAIYIQNGSEDTKGQLQKTICHPVRKKETI